MPLLPMTCNGQVTKMTWPEVQMTWQSSHQVQPSLLHLHWHYSNDQCQLRRQWNAGQPEMNLIAVSSRLQVIASFWKNKINFDKMAPEMQRQSPQHRIRISIISPIFPLALISRPEKRPFSRYWSPLAVATVTSRLQSCHELRLPLDRLVTSETFRTWANEDG